MSVSGPLSHSGLEIKLVFTYSSETNSKQLFLYKGPVLHDPCIFSFSPANCVPFRSGTLGPEQGYMLGTAVNGTLSCKSGLTVKKYLTSI